MLYKSWNQTVVSEWTKTCVMLIKNPGGCMRKQNLFYYLRAFALQQCPGGIPGMWKSGMSDCDTTKARQCLIPRNETFWGKDKNSIKQRAVLLVLGWAHGLEHWGKKRSNFHRDKIVPTVTMWIKMLNKKSAFLHILQKSEYSGSLNQSVRVLLHVVTERVICEQKGTGRE